MFLWGNISLKINFKVGMRDFTLQVTESRLVWTVAVLHPITHQTVAMPLIKGTHLILDLALISSCAISIFISCFYSNTLDYFQHFCNSEVQKNLIQRTDSKRTCRKRNTLGAVTGGIRIFSHLDGIVFEPKIKIKWKEKSSNIKLD